MATRRFRLGRRYRLVLTAVMAAALIAAAPWIWIRASAGPHVQALAPGSDAPHAEAALVLGTLVNPDGSLSPRLEERVDVAVELYASGAVPVLVMSGTPTTDTGQNEPDRMRDYATSRGVPASAIVLDPTGLDTHASCAAAAGKLGLSRILVVTNEYHAYRATWLCRQAGLDATGVYAPPSSSATIARENLREFGAAWKALGDVARD